jgi:hypothetical protein
MLLKTEGGLQPGHRPQKQLSENIRRDHSCHTKRLKHTPLFWQDDFLSGSDNRRYGLIRAGYWLVGPGETCPFFAVSRTILGEPFEPIPESGSGQIMGDFMEPEVSVQPLM